MERIGNSLGGIICSLYPVSRSGVAVHLLSGFELQDFGLKIRKGKLTWPDAKRQSTSLKIY